MSKNDVKENMITPYQFRGDLFYKRNLKDKPIINFQQIRKGIPGLSHSQFQDGPKIIIDNQKNTVFELLYQIKKINPSKEDIKSFLLSFNKNLDTEGIYLIDTGNKKSIIKTKSIIDSITKVIYEVIYANNKSDIFLKRLARSTQIVFKVLSFNLSIEKAAFYSGLYNTLDPDTIISDKVINYRSFKEYSKGLLSAGNWRTFLIESLLDQGKKPDFLTKREIKIYRGELFKEREIVSKETFDQLLLDLIKEKG